MLEESGNGRTEVLGTPQVCGNLGHDAIRLGDTAPFARPNELLDRRVAQGWPGCKILCEVAQASSRVVVHGTRLGPDLDWLHSCGHA